MPANIRFALILLGFVAASFFTGCSTVPERSTKSYADLSQNAPVRVVEIASNSDESVGVLIIQIGSFGCPDKLRRSIFIRNDGIAIIGCADIQASKIVVELEDGHLLNIRTAERDA